MNIIELTKRARVATGENIGTVVRNGEWAVARYTKTKGKRTLDRELLTEWTSFAGVCQVLSEMSIKCAS